MSEEDIVRLCPTRRGILKYGEILTDDEFCEKQYDCDGPWDKCTRIRIVKYENKLYYDKTGNGKVVEFKELN